MRISLMSMEDAMRRKVITNWNDIGVLIDVDTLSLIMGCTPATITRWTREGRIQSVQINRRHLYDKEYIRQLLANREREHGR